MLIAENIHCIVGERSLFKGLGFCLQPGALLLLKGANGSGKTSLLKVLSGLLPAASGEITWDGKPIHNNADFRRELMLVGHKSAVKLDATVLENLAFWGKIYNTEMLVPAAMRFYDLEKFAESPARELSSGWQRRVALARLIVVPCKLWMLDEPTNFLDEEAIILTASLIESRVKQGGIVIAASHVMQSAVASHTLQMEDFHPSSCGAAFADAKDVSTGSHATYAEGGPARLRQQDDAYV